MNLLVSWVGEGLVYFVLFKRLIGILTENTLCEILYFTHNNLTK